MNTFNPIKKALNPVILSVNSILSNCFSLLFYIYILNLVDLLSYSFLYILNSPNENIVLKLRQLALSSCIKRSNPSERDNQLQIFSVQVGWFLSKAEYCEMNLSRFKNNRVVANIVRSKSFSGFHVIHDVLLQGTCSLDMTRSPGFEMMGALLRKGGSKI